jgi:hypothetical protein
MLSVERVLNRSTSQVMSHGRHSPEREHLCAVSVS